MHQPAKQRIQTLAPADGRVSRRPLTAVVAAYRRHRFAWLFASLLLTLGAGPTLEAVYSRQNPLALLLGLNLLAAIASVAHEADMRIPLLLGVVFVVARTLRAALALPGLLQVSDALWLVAVWGIRDRLRTRPPDPLPLRPIDGAPPAGSPENGAGTT